MTRFKIWTEALEKPDATAGQFAETVEDALFILYDVLTKMPAGYRAFVDKKEVDDAAST